MFSLFRMISRKKKAKADFIREIRDALSQDEMIIAFSEYGDHRVRGVRIRKKQLQVKSIGHKWVCPRKVIFASKHLNYAWENQYGDEERPRTRFDGKAT